MPYTLLPLLRQAFNVGDDVNKTFELLKSVEFGIITRNSGAVILIFFKLLDLGASLLHALCFGNPAVARSLSPISPIKVYYDYLF